MTILWSDNYSRVAETGVVAVLLALLLATVGQLHEISKPLHTQSSSVSYSPCGLCCLGKDVHVLCAIFVLGEITVY